MSSLYIDNEMMIMNYIIEMHFVKLLLEENPSQTAITVPSGAHRHRLSITWVLALLPHDLAAFDSQ